MARSDMRIPRSGPGADGGIITQRHLYRNFVLVGVLPATAGNFGTIFFTPTIGDYELIYTTERHATAGNDGGAVTVMLKKVANGAAASAGTDMLSAGIDLKAAADTNQAGSLSATAANLILTAGFSAAFVLTGTPTALAGLCIETIWKRL